MDKSQLMKGILEGCILKIISRDEIYGYEIAKKLQEYGFSDSKEGTLYPILLRLEKKKLIIADFKDSPLGPKRKYYSLTEDGKEQVVKFEVAWKEIGQSVTRVLEEV